MSQSRFGLRGTPMVCSSIGVVSKLMRTTQGYRVCNSHCRSARSHVHCGAGYETEGGQRIHLQFVVLTPIILAYTLHAEHGAGQSDMRLNSADVSAVVSGKERLPTSASVGSSEGKN